MCEQLRRALGALLRGLTDPRRHAVHRPIRPRREPELEPEQPRESRIRPHRPEGISRNAGKPPSPAASFSHSSDRYHAGAARPDPQQGAKPPHLADISEYGRVPKRLRRRLFCDLRRRVRSTPVRAQHERRRPSNGQTRCKAKTPRLTTNAATYASFPDLPAMPMPNAAAQSPTSA